MAIYIKSTSSKFGTKHLILANVECAENYVTSPSSKSEPGGSQTALQRIDFGRRNALALGVAAIGTSALASASSQASAGERKSPMELAERLKRIEDVEAIRSLRNMYHYFINESLPDGFREIYVDDASLQFEDKIKWEGIDQIVEGFRTMPERTPLIKQFIHNHEITLAGEEASAFAYFEARYATLDKKSLMVAGRYDENYRHTEKGWRIARTFVKLIYSVPHDVGWAGENLDYFPNANREPGR